MTINMVPTGSPVEGFKNQAGNQENIVGAKYELTGDISEEIRAAYGRSNITMSGYCQSGIF